MITINQLPKKVVIVGTDTEIGKTYIACKIIELWQKNNIDTTAILAIKPLVSGSLNNTEPLKWDDIERLKLTNITQVVHFYGFQPAISPDAGALLSNPRIFLSAQNIIEKINQTISESIATHVIIEGAGGVFLPLNDTESFLDILVSLQIPIVLVVGMKLGGINHALLTLEALLSRHIVVAGWVANSLPQYSVPFYMLERLEQRFLQKGILQIQL